MDSFEINGQEYNFLFSLRAIGDYQKRLLEAKENDSTSSVDELYEWAKLGFKYGNKGVLPFDESVLVNWMDDNFEDALKISSYCRKKMIRFNQALTGQEMAESVENGQSKKKKVTS
jgi:hypothetical protein